ncbi:hypothetical protein VTL71DRAFT_3776 [Oculimacula yallundae]|uniref:Uncharacterized protein n=1 Tax=Oculimacula yallundae TaxID=86028 RepID=A0ABR4C5V1_9HELO
MAARRTIISEPIVTPRPIPTRSAVLNPVVDVLIGLGTEFVEFGEDCCVVDEEVLKVFVVGTEEGERVCVADDPGEEVNEAEIDGPDVESEEDKASTTEDPSEELACPADGVATAVPLCTAEHTLKAFCLAVGTASAPVQRPSRIPKLIQAPDNVPSLSPDVVVAEHKHSRVGFDEQVLSGNCCSTEDFRHGCAQAGRKADILVGRETEYAFWARIV